MSSKEKAYLIHVGDSRTKGYFRGKPPSKRGVILERDLIFQGGETLGEKMASIFGGEFSVRDGCVHIPKENFQEEKGMFKKEVNGLEISLHPNDPEALVAFSKIPIIRL